jgi:hypothetical protein
MMSIQAFAIHSLAEATQHWNTCLRNLKTSPTRAVEAAAATFRRWAEMNDQPSLVLGADKLVHWKTYGISHVNVGGTMGCGKSSIAAHIEKQLGAPWLFQDADFFHTQEAKDKMRRRIPLDDFDREPFLRGVQGFLRQAGGISSCSASKPIYRQVLDGREVAAIFPGADQSWPIKNPQLGLLQIIVDKPYEVALDQLDATNTGRAAKRQLGADDHYINVTKATEAEDRAAGRTPLLESQYIALGDPALIPPWEALIVRPEDFRSDSVYNMNAMLQQVLNLPFRHLKM